jgi:hypothetical protein
MVSRGSAQERWRKRMGEVGYAEEVINIRHGQSHA